MNKKFFVCAIVALLAFGGQAALAQEKEITYSQGDPTELWGTNYGNAETYDVAMLMNDKALAGLKIKQLRVPFPFTEGISEARVWLSKQLPAIKSGKMQSPDIVAVDFTPVADDWATITLDEPYTLTEEGVYVGYSFKTEKPNENTAQPVVTTKYTSTNGFLVHTTGKYRTAFHDLYPYAGQLAMEVVLSGTGIKDNAVAVVWMPELNLVAGESGMGQFKMVNHGTQGVSSIEYTVSIGGKEETYQTDVELRPVFGAFTDVDFRLPAVSDKGAYNYTLTVTKVNGQSNEDNAPALSAKANVYTFLPKHRAVLEEYTGTWCGYCPRGFVGLEEMNRLYPDDFIGISYHNGDPMEITSNFPSPVSGFPDAWLDRVSQTDAFCGDSQPGTFGIDKAWERRCEVFAPASIDIETQWTDNDHLQATAHTTFPIDSDECPYELCFALIQDGMTGTGSGWNQSNYYNGQSGWPASMDQFTQGNSSVSGLVFNDVIVARSSVAGLSGSLQAPIVADVAQSYSYTFDMNTVQNTSKENIVQDKNLLRVVVLLIDTRTGEIANANKCNAGHNTGIDATTLSRDASVDSVSYYNLQGQLVSSPQHGIFVRLEKLSNGKVITRKIKM